jgi:DNA polymerase-3 subunit beta
VAVPAKLLSDIVSRLDGETVEFELQDWLLLLRCRHSKFEIRCIDPQEYPSLPVPGGTPISIPSESLSSGLRVAFASSNDETKMVLCGVHVQGEKGELRFAATNGHFLGMQSLEGEDFPTLIIPSMAVSALSKIPAGETVTVTTGQAVATFAWNRHYLTVRMIDGTYPNYPALVPNQFSITAVVDRVELIRAVERVAVIADQKNNVVVLEWSAESVVISADAQDVGGGREVVTCQLIGDSLELAFNVKYLLESLKFLESSSVQVELNTGTSPVVLSSLSDPRQRVLVMPVQIRS